MTSTPAICYVLMSFPQPSETFIADEAASLLDRGIDVQVLQLGSGDRSTVHASAQALLEGNRVHDLQESTNLAKLKALFGLILHRPAGVWSALARCIRSAERWRYLQALPIAHALARRRVGYVHAHFADVNLLVAEVIADWLGCPFGVTFHGYDIREQLIPRSRAIATLERAGLVVTISRLNQESLEQVFRLPRHRIRIVHCGIDLGRFRFRMDDRIARKGFTLATVGRLHPVKGQADLLQAMALLVARNVDCRLEIVGAGPLHASLVEQAGRLGITDRVRFWGAQTSDRVIEIVSSADVFVLSSHNEGLPVVAIESMALGTPVVSTAVAAVPELIADGESGLLVEARNPPMLADAIEKLLNQPVWAREMAVAARRKVELEFDRGRCTDELLAAIGHTLGQPVRRRSTAMAG